MKWLLHYYSNIDKRLAEALELIRHDRLEWISAESVDEAWELVFEKTADLDLRDGSVYIELIPIQ